MLLKPTSFQSGSRPWNSSWIHVHLRWNQSLQILISPWSGQDGALLTFTNCLSCMQLEKVVLIKYLLRILTLKEQKPFWEELEFISLCLWDVYVVLELLGVLFLFWELGLCSPEGTHNMGYSFQPVRQTGFPSSLLAVLALREICHTGSHSIKACVISTSIASAKQWRPLLSWAVF